MLLLHFSVLAGENSLAVHVVQTLTVSLGMVGEAPAHAQHESMATVCRISRNVLFPPQFRTLQEWFHYAFASSDLDGELTFSPVKIKLKAMAGFQIFIFIVKFN